MLALRFHPPAALLSQVKCSSLAGVITTYPQTSQRWVRCPYRPGSWQATQPTAARPRLRGRPLRAGGRAGTSQAPASFWERALQVDAGPAVAERVDEVPSLPVCRTHA